MVKEKLIARLRDGFHPPGQRFFSNRGLAGHFGVSYQTAHRLIGELVDEGFLERRPAAGTYVAGPAVAWRGAALVFHERAKRAGSFGARMLAHLRAGLDQAGIASEVVWGADAAASVLGDDWLPVVWECPAVVAAGIGRKRFLVMLNDTPPPGLAASFVDSIACDDFSGGTAAAELMRGGGVGARVAVMAGPRGDLRSRQRVEGFLSLLPATEVFWAPSWFAEEAAPLAKEIAERNFEGIFCGNDRLAEALLAVDTAATVIGFDDAPVAEAMNLTTIAIPWAEMVAEAVDVIRQRIAGDTGAAAKRIFAPRPVVRRSGVGGA